MAALTGMLLIKFIGEDLGFFAAVRTFANKRFQTLKLLKSWTVPWDAHLNLLFQT